MELPGLESKSPSPSIGTKTLHDFYFGNHGDRQDQGWVGLTKLSMGVIKKVKTPVLVAGESLVHVKHLFGKLLADVTWWEHMVIKLNS